jgi:hypothetical protein
MRKSSFLLHSAFCLLTSAFFLCGCDLPGALLHVALGEPPVDAQYVPPKGPTLVMVENYRSPDAMQLDGDQIAHEVADELKKEAKMEMVDPDKLAPLREDDGDKFRGMDIQAVGKAVGAKQVIYVDLLESDVKQDTSAGAVHATATARVKVVDIQTGNTLWPSGSSHGKEISQSIEFDQMDPAKAVTMHTEMLANLSSKVAKLFYTWKPDGQDQENNGG